MKRIFTLSLILAMCFGVRLHADEDLGQLLESGIYQQQTVGDLDAAIKCYEQVVAKNKSNRKLAAQALHHIIQCYLKQNKSSEARKAMETLTREYAAFDTVIKQARKLLPNVLEIGDVPWPDGEQMTLKLQAATGMEIGTLVFTAQQLKATDQDPDTHRWAIDSFMSVPVSNLAQYTHVVADEKTFVPTLGITDSSMTGRLVADYQSDQVKLKRISKSGTGTNIFQINQQVFDNEQVMYLIRRLPLAMDYQASFAIFSVHSGMVVDCQIKVVGKETIKTKAGSYDCWKVNLKVLAQGVTALSHDLWYSVEQEHLLVKYNSGAVVMLLDDVSTLPEHAMPVEIEKGITLLQPETWHFYTNPNPGQYKTSVQLLSDTQTWAVFMTAEAQGSGVSLKQIVESDAKVVKDFFKDYVVDEASWMSRQIAGVDALSYVANYRQKKLEKIEYRTYLVKDGQVMWFVFRTDKDRFEENKPVYDQIIESLNVTEQQAENVQAAPGEPGGPMVLQTTPVALANDVDPNLKQMTVTFDQPMIDGSWSWTGGGETFPKRTGAISYDKAYATCTMPVKLEPGKVYWVGINSPSHRNFQSIHRKPARRYAIVFATRDEHGKPTPIPEDWIVRAKAINQPHHMAANSAKQQAQELASKGWKRWSQRQFAEAEELFQKSVALDPTNGRSLNGLGWSQFNQGNADEAEKTFERLLKLEPKHAAALNGMGWINHGRDQWEKAVECWEKAIKASPNATAALSGLATVYMTHGQYDKAVKVYEQWLNVQPDSQQVKDGLAKARAGLEHAKTSTH